MNLSQYMESLQKLLALRSEYSTIHPGHGPVVTDGHERVREYINHRLERERELVAALAHPAPDGGKSWTAMEIVAEVYATIPKGYWNYAAHSVTLHLQKLENDGRAIALQGEKNGEKAWHLATL